ncbi:MAG: prohibitin family protein [Bacteroidetes bacterium]|nr:prohibitin family protein [Bacteroidota bacterium]
MNNVVKVIIIAVAALVFVGIFTSTIFITINPGEEALLFRRFAGGVNPEAKTMKQGFHVIAPWNKAIIYDVKIQTIEEKMTVLSSNGLNVIVDVTIRYKPSSSKLGNIHNEIGRDYSQKVVIPEARSAARKIIGRYTPEEFYSTKREAVQTELEHTVALELEKKDIILDALLLRDIKLPETIQMAIERKLKQEQESLEYEFRLEKERKEAERREIEAEGIKKFQDIVSEGISENYLRWKGIEATESLAKSENATTIVIGSGKDGLPLILGR